jgi:hypothetical protein
VSNQDSFIDEVTEEVKRDRLYAMMRRYGWIPVVVVLGIVGGTAYREYNRATEQAAAEAFGDSVLAALEVADIPARISALGEIAATGADNKAVLEMLIAAEEGVEGDDAAAVARLQMVANDTNIPNVYRQIGSYKALSRASDVLTPEERKSGFEALAVAGQPLRVLAEEQLALIDIESGDTEAAMKRLQALIVDSEASAGLRRRATQLIVALGGSVEQG